MKARSETLRSSMLVPLVAVFVGLGGMVGLSGCQSTDVLTVDSTAPLGQAARTGTTPLFVANPTGATAQLTPAQEADIRRDLQRSAMSGAHGGRPDNAAVYERDLADLQRSADALTNERLARIRRSTKKTKPAAKPANKAAPGN